MSWKESFLSFKRKKFFVKIFARRFSSTMAKKTVPSTWSRGCTILTFKIVFADSSLGTSCHTQKKFKIGRRKGPPTPGTPGSPVQNQYDLVWHNGLVWLVSHVPPSLPTAETVPGVAET